jgi:uncharacterized protein YaiI (UPF0178 family)
MLDLFIDIDRCPVLPQVLRVAQRHLLPLYVVTRDYVELGGDVHLILAQADDAGGADWIAANIGQGDICITDEAKLAAACLRRGAFALMSSGVAWTVEVVASAAVPVSTPRLGRGDIDTRQFAQRLDATIAEVRSRSAATDAAAGALGRRRGDRVASA